MELIKRFYRLCYEIGKRYFTDRLTYSASALTFTTLLALVPLLTIFIAIFSAFPIAHNIGDVVSQFIYQNFLPAAGDVIQKYLQNFVIQAGKLSWLGTIFLVVTVVMMMLTITSTFNNIWKAQCIRQGIFAILKYWVILSLALIFITLSIATTSYVITLPVIIGAAKALGMHELVVRSAPFVLTVLAFWFIYVAVPNCKVPLRYGLIAAIIATILFEGVKKFFVIYISNFATYSLIYGPLSAIPIFLMWIYLLWVVILFGALISNVLTIHYFARKVGELD